jgi:hypothetical protein
MKRIPLSHFVVFCFLNSLQQARSPLFKEAASRIFAINTMYYSNICFVLYYSLNCFGKHFGVGIISEINP